MTAQPESDLAGDFTQDFLNEAAEHLLSISNDLLKLEGLVLGRAGERGPGTTVPIIDSLFRSCHTLKGLSGMVGLKSAVDLSHAMESVLRDIQQGYLLVTPTVVDALVKGRQTLEAVISTVGVDDPAMPEIASNVRQMQDMRNAAAGRASGDAAAAAPAVAVAVPDDPAALLNDADWDTIGRRIAAGQSVSLVRFTPSAALAAAGINVNHVREQLGRAGEILKAFPLITGGAIGFGFVLSSNGPAGLSGLPVEVAPLAPPRDAESAVPNPAPDALPYTPASAAPTIRVDIARLDELMRLVGDLMVTRLRLSDALTRFNGHDAGTREMLDESNLRLERQLRELRQAIMRVRMVPLSEVFGRMPLAVRDLAHASGKQVRLRLEGQETEIDKALTDRLLDPLLHLVRNAITHGIEPPGERAHQGKPEQGTILLRGQPEGDHINISVSDDGQGVDVNRVAEKAQAMGLIAPGQVLSPDDVLAVLCRSGFSTRSSADTGAGRGVGMDVVADAVASLGGSLSLQTAPGRGTTFTLRLPLTLAIIDALIVASGADRYAVPQSAVSDVLEIDPTRVTVVAGGGELFAHRGAALPLIRLGPLFQCPPGALRSTQFQYGLRTSDGGAPGAVIVVDAILGLRETVVRTITDPLVAQPGIAGATELGDGSIALILDVPELLQFAKARP